MVHIAINVNTEIEINSLSDLLKLKMLSESEKKKINKSWRDGAPDYAAK